MFLLAWVWGLRNSVMHTDANERFLALAFLQWRIATRGRCVTGIARGYTWISLMGRLVRYSEIHSLSHIDSYSDV